jgi:hypothetical protein
VYRCSDAGSVTSGSDKEAAGFSSAGLSYKSAESTEESPSLWLKREKLMNKGIMIRMIMTFLLIMIYPHL